jgi:RND superfamily putative drug exporter
VPVPESPDSIFREGELRRLWDRVGDLLLRRAGTVWLLTFALMAPFAVAAGLLYNHISYDMIGTLPADASSAAGTRILQEHFPAGIFGPVNVLLIDPKVDFSGEEGRALVGQLTDRLHAQRELLGLADVRSLTAPLGITQAAAHPFADLNVPEDVRKEAVEHAALDYYVTDLGERKKIGTRLDLILQQSPFSRQTIEDLDRLEQSVRDVLPATVREDAQLYFGGMTASMHDLAAVIEQDRVRIELLVLAVVFLILFLLLRRFVVTLYLLLSVLFSYYTTLGVTFAVFWLLDPAGFPGIDWKVAIFLFTILIAVGEDYNIFLMSRIDEEQRRYGPVRGITEGLDRTGPVISSCGLIMAGTFASLLAGSLTEMKQLGFALAFGVLLDTFVVRPILVPAFLILLHSGRLPLPVRAGWPLRGPHPRHAASETRAGS